MITLPASVMRMAGTIGNWCIKNGPKIMSVAGGVMAVGGAVMACEATTHADEVLERHRQKMAKIDEAYAVSEAAGDGEFTETDMKRGKTGVYVETALDFARLYGPAIAVGLSGVGLMQSAFVITDRRRASAVAALTTMDQMYQNLLTRTNEEVPELRLNEVNPAPNPLADETGETDKLVLDPCSESDPFFFIFDKTNPNWHNTSFLLNERFIASTIENYQYRISGYTVPQVWINNILDSLDIENVDYGYFYGYNPAAGDQIEYQIVPFVEVWNDEDSSQMPMLVETTMDKIREMELNDVETGYCFGIRLKASCDGYDELTDPRFIYNEVYGK